MKQINTSSYNSHQWKSYFLVNSFARLMPMDFNPKGWLYHKQIVISSFLYCLPLTPETGPNKLILLVHGSSGSLVVVYPSNHQQIGNKIKTFTLMTIMLVLIRMTGLVNWDVTLSGIKLSSRAEGAQKSCCFCCRIIYVGLIACK